MRTIPLIRTSNLVPFIHFLDRIGTPTHRLLTDLYIEREFIFNPHAICTENQMWSFLAKSARLEGIENLGILVAQQSNIEDLGIFGEILLQSVTLKDCLDKFIAFIGKHHSQGKERFWLNISENEAFFCTKNPYKSEKIGSFQATGYTIIFMLNLLKSYLGNKWKPNYIYLQDCNRNIWENCASFADINLYYQQDYYAIAFPRDLLYKTKIENNLTIDSFKLNSWQSFNTPENLPQSLQIILKSMMPEGNTKLDVIAEIVGISKRSLNRLLQKQQTSYKEILRKTRYQIAVEKLAYTNISIAEIAFDLGYSDPAHFTRAFKKWSGCNPSQFREKIIQ